MLPRMLAMTFRQRWWRLVPIVHSVRGQRPRWFQSPAADLPEFEMISFAPPSENIEHFHFPIAVSVRGRPLMTSLTDRRRTMLLVASETNTHGCDAGRFGHPVHLRDLPVAHLAFHSN